MKIREVLRLAAEGLGQRQIAVSVNSARSTVQECLRRAKEAGIGWPLPEELDEAALMARLYPAKAQAEKRPEPDFDAVMRELSRKHVTRRQLWREYVERHPGGLKYTAFCVRYRKWRGSVGADVTMSIEHEPGDKLCVDYSGDPAYWVDRNTGERMPAQLFLSAWGFSHKIFAVATPTQNTEDWVNAHVKALDFYGCVPAAFVPDNTKTAVIKACYYEPEKNRDYAEFAEHYGCAIVPARKLRPRDKGSVENAVLIAQRRILGALRDAVFFSLPELNAAIAAIVDEINAEKFQKKDGSRNSLFEAYEKPAAKPLPKRRYEYGTWKKAVVHPDHHVQADKGYYSVHYSLIGQEVWVRLGARLVKISQHGKVIATHPRVDRPWQRRTLPEHRPEKHRAYLDLGFDKLMERAQKIGPNTVTVLAKQPQAKKHLDETIRAAMGILRLADDFTPAALERACALAVEHGVYGYRMVRDLIVAQRDPGKKGRKTPTKSATAGLMHANVRGAGYYGDGAIN